MATPTHSPLFKIFPSFILLGSNMTVLHRTCIWLLLSVIYYANLFLLFGALMFLVTVFWWEGIYGCHFKLFSIPQILVLSYCICLCFVESFRVRLFHACFCLTIFYGFSS